MQNRNLAEIFKGGVIMDVTTPEQARIAEGAGAYPCGYQGSRGCIQNERPKNDQRNQTRH